MQLQPSDALPKIMLARYYGNSLPRFLSPDPLGPKTDDPQDWNRYTYVRNNPLTLVDPDGLSWIDAPGGWRPTPGKGGLHPFVPCVRCDEEEAGGQDVEEGDGSGDGKTDESQSAKTKQSWNPKEPFPSDPTKLGPDWKRDSEHKAPHEERYVNDKTGDKVDWHKAEPGKKGERGKDHWHWVPQGEKDKWHYKPGDHIKEPSRFETFLKWFSAHTLLPSI